MPTFDEKFLNELKNKNNLVDVASKYCVLKRNGPSNYWACCPLPGHSEKTPSFSINEPGQFYHCFGCGKGGDVIKFIEEVEGLDFIESVKLLAENAKMEIPEEDKDYSRQLKVEKDKKDRLLTLIRDTAVFYVRNLKSKQGEKALAYLKKRGFTDETIKAFGFGYSDGYDALPQYLRSKGYTYEEMLETGVCSKSQSGKVFDAVANRLVIPVINQMGKVIAFIGRILEGSSKIGKYKNTAETRFFSKKRTLYGINNLKKERIENDLSSVIIVEGNLDVVSLYQAGFKNVVASQGTAFTLEHVKLLKRYTSKVLISFDGDSAGQSATLKSLDLFTSQGFEVKIVNLPEGQDPDDVVKNSGYDGYKKLLNSAEPLIDFKLKVIEKGKDLSITADKRKYVQECLALIKTVNDEFLKEELLKKVRDKSGITYESLRRDLDNGTVTVKDDSPIIINRTVVKNKLSIAERFILCAYAFNKPYKSDCDLEELFFSDEVRDAVALYFIENGENSNISTLSRVVGEKGYEELDAILTAGDKVFDKNGEEKFFKDCVTEVMRSNIQSKITALNQEHVKLTDLQKRDELAQIISELTIKMSQL